MGKYEAVPQKDASSGGKKKHIGLWIALAVLTVIVAWGIWFFTTPPAQDTIGDPVQDQPVEQPDNTVQPPATQQPDDSQQQPPAAEQPDEPVVVNKKELKQDYYTILLAGTVDGYNTDTMMLCAVDVKASRMV